MSPGQTCWLGSVRPQQAPSHSEAACRATTTLPRTPNDRTGSTVWEVDVLGKDHKSHDITVDAATGKVLNQHVDQDDDND
ncbi:PepSY domain-containing protein [Streptomyces sp. NPDC005962]|uniref:PepSY domain-containing protein n=1 Tax=Streptomyces sp. NPDC005962 TaxID=3154466 RepID=UPI0033D41AA7